jgi:hypothetical protein
MYRSFKIICCLLLTSNLSAQYIYENNQDLYDLNGNANDFEGELAYSVSDDGISPAIDLSFDFSFYGSTFSQARMATNGCLHFGSSGSYCNDYTPDPINGQHTYTIYPFWTDLIRDNNSRMKSWGDSNKMIFGWYNLREYNRSNSDNSFEVILWNNNSFDLRYGHLDVINHDVLIGEVGANKANSYTYYYHDECNTGTTNSSSCYTYDWNNSDKNTNLENGGSLYGSGSGNNLDCSNPLNDATCPGYADAYQTQQCDIDQLYSESCSGYAQAYQTQQCDIDQLYSEACPGYAQAYQTQQCDIDQLYSEECPYYAETYLSQQCDITDLYSESCPNYWDAYDDQQCEEDPQYAPFCAGYRQTESVAFFDDTNVDYGYEEEIIFEEFVFEEEIIFEQVFPSEEYYEPVEIMQDFYTHEEEVFLPTEDLIVEEFIFQETFIVEDYTEPETFIEFETIEELEEWFEEEIAVEEELAYAEEPEEELIKEPVEEEVIEELVVSEEKSSISKEMALNVVSSTLATAQASVSGTTAGTSVHATGNSAAAGNAVSSSSNSGISTSSSPSMSDQFASSTAQTNQVLDMSSMAVADTSISTSTSTNTSTVETETTTTEVVVATVVTVSSQDSLNISVDSVSTDSDTETTVENIIAENLQNAQEDVQTQQEETGEYGSENAIIAVMGFVPGFNSYRLVSLPEKEVWYEPKSIYTTNTIQDNTAAFYQLAGTNIRTLTKLKEMQPTF